MQYPAQTILDCSRQLDFESALTRARIIIRDAKTEMLKRNFYDVVHYLRFLLDFLSDPVPFARTLNIYDNSIVTRMTKVVSAIKPEIDDLLNIYHEHIRRIESAIEPEELSHIKKSGLLVVYYKKFMHLYKYRFSRAYESFRFRHTDDMKLGVNDDIKSFIQSKYQKEHIIYYCNSANYEISVLLGIINKVMRRSFSANQKVNIPYAKETQSAYCNCPHCSHRLNFTLQKIIDIKDGSENLRRLLATDFFSRTCERCLTEESFPYECDIIDYDKKFLIHFNPDEADVSSYAVTKKYRNYRIRYVTDPMSIMEKILIFKYGLDDAAVEVLKAKLFEDPDKYNIKGSFLYFYAIISDNEEISLNFYNYQGDDQQPADISVPISCYSEQLEKAEMIMEKIDTPVKKISSEEILKYLY